MEEMTLSQLNQDEDYMLHCQSTIVSFNLEEYHTDHKPKCNVQIYLLPYRLLILFIW
jgi:hypothetical protein